ncbi:MAG: WGR domain-containing protein [Myxococcota bacterium]
MARFELDDGRVQRFWEVALDGEVLTFRYGDLGSAGRTRSKACPTERQARAAYDDAVRSMLSQGYRRVISLPDGPEPEPAPMWPRLEEDPDDPEALAVHADWLLARDDVRGEVLALELAGRSDEAKAVREAHRDVLHGPIGAFPGRVELTWAWGYVRSVRFEPTDHRGVDPAGAAAAILASESLRLVRGVDLQVPSAVDIAMSRHLPAVRRLVLHTGVVGNDWQPSDPLDLDALARCMPRLRSLKVRGVSEVRGIDAVLGLEQLDVRFSPGWIERIRVAGAQLRELGVHGIDADSVDELASSGRFGALEQLSLTPSWSAMPGVLAALRSGPAPRRLVLAGVDLDRSDVTMLESLPGLEQIAIDGTVSQAAHVALAQSRLQVVGQVRLRPEQEDEDEEPERPRDLAVQRLEYVNERSRFFWEIGRVGSVHHVRYGQMGSRGRWIWRRFPSEDIAEEILERRVEEKLREGYTPCRTRVLVG